MAVFAAFSGIHSQEGEKIGEKGTYLQRNILYSGTFDPGAWHYFKHKVRAWRISDHFRILQHSYDHAQQFWQYDISSVCRICAG